MINIHHFPFCRLAGEQILVDLSNRGKWSMDRRLDKPTTLTIHFIYLVTTLDSPDLCGEPAFILGILLYTYSLSYQVYLTPKKNTLIIHY